jgi:hypothetical protein
LSFSNQKRGQTPSSDVGLSPLQKRLICQSVNDGRGGVLKWFTDWKERARFLDKVSVVVNIKNKKVSGSLVVFTK